MSGPSTLTRLAKLLSAAAAILRTFSNSNLAKGIISRETQIAARIEGISIEVAALEERKRNEASLPKELSTDRADDKL